AGTERDLGEALGQGFVQKNCPPELKQKTLQMVQQIEREMEADIRSLEWMSPETKQRALEKSAAMANKIGYPDRWRDYSSIKLGRDDFLGNVARSARFETARELGRIGKPIDRGEWEITPQTVNAYYNPSMNDMNFPAAVLLPAALRPEDGRGTGLRGHRRHHRARAHARVRRPGAPVRRPGESQGLVDEAGRGRVHPPRLVHLRPVLELHRGRRCPCERQA